MVFKIALQRLEFLPVVMARAERTNGLRDEDVIVAGRAEMLGQPAHFALEVAEFPSSQQVLEQGERRPQPPRPDPHLMDPFRIAPANGGLIGGKMLEALESDDGECVGYR